jgi:hypothetical protein
MLKKFGIPKLGKKSIYIKPVMKSLHLLILIAGRTGLQDRGWLWRRSMRPATNGELRLLMDGRFEPPPGTQGSGAFCYPSAVSYPVHESVLTDDQARFDPA